MLRRQAGQFVKEYFFGFHDAAVTVVQGFPVTFLQQFRAVVPRQLDIGKQVFFGEFPFWHFVKHALADVG